MYVYGISRLQNLPSSTDLIGTAECWDRWAKTFLTRASPTAEISASTHVRTSKLTHCLLFRMPVLGLHEILFTNVDPGTRLTVAISKVQLARSGSGRANCTRACNTRAPVLVRGLHRDLCLVQSLLALCLTTSEDSQRRCWTGLRFKGIGMAGRGRNLKSCPQ